jgi:adenylyltransferase/sulfurtransferase
MQDIERYSRQSLFDGIGTEGQKRICAARVVLAGCGALGSASADMLVRAGVGTLRIVDRDFIELNNLQRQTLFDEEDIRAGLPKAVAAEIKLRRVNSQVRIEANVDDINARNIETLLGGFDLIVDATDNFETRYLVNDFAVKTGTPWIYGGAVRCEGRTLTIVPGRTPCLRCVYETPPEPGSVPTAETAGILGPLVNVVSSMQVTEALKLLAGRTADLRRGLLSFDVWRGVFRTTFASPSARRPACPACGKRRLDFLEGEGTFTQVVPCGVKAFQIHPPEGTTIDLDRLAGRLDREHLVLHSEFMLRFSERGREITVFRDGRAIIKGTADPKEAHAFYSRFIGS